MSSFSSSSLLLALALVQVEHRLLWVQAHLVAVARAGVVIHFEASSALEAAVLLNARAGLVVPDEARGQTDAGHWAIAFTGVFVKNVVGLASIVADNLLDVADALTSLSLQVVAVVANSHANFLAFAGVLVEGVAGLALEAAGVQGPFALTSRSVPVVAESTIINDVPTEVLARAGGLDESLVFTALQFARRNARARVLVDGVVLGALKQASRGALAVVQIQRVEHRARQFTSRVAIAGVQVHLVEGRALKLTGRLALANVSVHLEVVGATNHAGRVASAHAFVHFLEGMWAFKLAR